MTISRLLLVLCGLSFLIPGSVYADSLNPEEVSTEAKWAAHLDVERLWSTQLGALLKEVLEEEEDLAKIEAFGTIFEFDPFKDLFSITAYGCSFEEEHGVALFKGRFEMHGLHIHTQYVEPQVQQRTLRCQTAG